MVRVTITTTGEKLVMKLEGHAGYAKAGKDIVCASASILTHTLAQFVMDAYNRGYLKDTPEVKLRDGYAYIMCEPTEDNLPGLQNMFSFARMGYFLLAHNYPHHVEMRFDGEAE